MKTYNTPGKSKSIRFSKPNVKDGRTLQFLKPAGTLSGTAFARFGCKQAEQCQLITKTRKKEMQNLKSQNERKYSKVPKTGQNQFYG